MADNGAAWKFYRWSHESWEGMLSALEGARETIDFEQYYFVDLSEGLIGHRFIEVLERKAAEGVKVRLLLDATGSWEFYRSKAAVSKLRAAGVEIQFHETIPLKHAGQFFQSFLRDHRRLIVVDGTVALVGGTAIKESAEKWRDTHVRLEGPVVQSLQKSFDVLWKSVVTRDRYKITWPESSQDKFTVVPNGLLPTKRFIHSFVLDAIREAKKSVYVTTPYFIPTHQVFRALRLAARRGVDVRILVPEVCDSRVVQHVAESFFEGALRSGIKIYQYTLFFMHAKTIMVDEDWATVGSCNFDRLSFNLNYELNVVSYEPRFALELKNHFFDDLQSAIEVTPEEWRKRSIFRKIAEKALFLLRPFA